LSQAIWEINVMIMNRFIQYFVFGALWMAFSVVSVGGDAIKLKSGLILNGDITKRNDESVTIELKSGTRTLVRKIPRAQIESIEQSDNTQKAENGNALQRTEEAIRELIRESGAAMPDWFESTPLDYPDTLDLTWPDTDTPIWNYQRHIDHYLWDIIDTNASRYRQGVKLMAYLLERSDLPEIAHDKAREELGRMFFEFFQDYARAAFWWESAKVATNKRFRGTDSPARLAECYAQLGNRDMAMVLLNDIPLTPAVIKAWGGLRETDRALSLAKEAMNQGFEASEIHLLSGDACRNVGRYEEATRFYQLALEVEIKSPHKTGIERNHRRAKDTMEVIRLFDRLDLAKVKEGVYRDRSYGYSGFVNVEAQAKAGSIESVKVTSMSDRQYYHAVEETLQRIMSRQSVKGVDAVSGATVTSEAVIRATARALSQGMEP